MWTRKSSAGEVLHREGEADGGYLASAADLMIGLLFIFIILVVVLALEQRRQQEAMDKQRGELIGAGDPRGDVTGRIGEGIRLALPGVKVDRESGVISLPEDVLFELGRAELSEPGQAALAEASRRLAEVLPCYVANRRPDLACEGNRHKHEVDTVFIEGHTDNRPFRGGGRDNMDLSLARARAVEGALVRGTPLQDYRNKANQPIFSFSAYADTRPLKGVDPSDARNRRVDLRIVMTYRPIDELIPGLARPAR